MKTISISPGKYRNVLVETKNPTLALAAAELKLGLEKLFNTKITLVKRKAASPSLILKTSSGKNSNRQSYSINADKEDIVITGGDAIGTLYGVYALLEAMGIRFTAPGEVGIIVPRNPGTINLALPIQHSPRFTERMVYTEQRIDENYLDELNFLARIRINCVRAVWHEEFGGSAKLAAINAAAQIRGITFEVGGHEIDRLLPRELFATKPCCFRATGSGLRSPRSPDFNACAGNVETRTIMADNAAKFAKQHPGSNSFHFWPADVGGRTWCTCPLCKHLNSSDQSLLTANASAKGVRKSNPEAKVNFIAYLETVGPPENIEPEKNVLMLFAPRERCYGHSIGDHRCKGNSFYREMLKEQISWFGPGRSYVFEYYNDGILFRHTIPILTEVIEKDLRYYHQLGMKRICCLYTSTRTIDHAEKLNLLVFARQAFDGRQPASAFVRELVSSIFGENQKVVLKMLKRLEQIHARPLFQCGYGFKDKKGDLQWPVASSASAFPLKHEKYLEQALAELPAVKKQIKTITSGGNSSYAGLFLKEMALNTEIYEAELNIWLDQVKGQNRRTKYLKTGKVKDLIAARDHFLKSVKGIENAVGKFAGKIDRSSSYYIIQEQSMKKELLFFAAWCEEEKARICR